MPARVNWMKPILHDMMLFAELNNLPRLRIMLEEVTMELARVGQAPEPSRVLQFPKWYAPPEANFRSSRGAARKPVDEANEA